MASLKSQLAAKQTELAKAETDDEKATINSEITTLKSEIAAAQSSDKQSTQSTSQQQNKWGGNSGQPRWQEGRPPEGKVSSEVMDVLMKMSQGGMAPPNEGERPSASDLYAAMDTDGNGSVTKDEFVANRPDHASEDEATAAYNSIDTKGTGSITEEQFADSMKQNHGAGGPPMGPPPGGMQGMGPGGADLQQLLASLGASTEVAAA